MVISKSEQKEMDFDWFGVDADGHVGHFTTAGFKYLPASVCESAEDLKLVTDYFTDEAPTRDGHKVDDDLVREVKEWKGEEHESKYLASFVSMADKGLYSYDIETYVRPGLAYFRVAIPLAPLKVNELPDDVRRIVQRTVLQDMSFEGSSRVDYERTLGI